MASLEQHLKAQLDGLHARFPAVRQLRVALSGGLDSTVLLHACAALREEGLLPVIDSLSAIHVDHGLSPAAGQWALHCQTACAALDIPLTLCTVDVTAGADGHGGKIPEDAARQARYRVLAQHLDGNTAVLMAHHQDDQAETLLLRLLRGAGAGGLGAIPQQRPLGAGQLWRPLLGVARSELQDYATRSDLRWVDDPSNTDLRVDRNYLRHQVLPAIARRWPDYRSSWQGSARLCREAQQLNDVLADIDLRPARLASEPHCLDCSPLLSLERARQRNALRAWILERSGQSPPGWLLYRLADEVLPARPDARPQIIWQGTVLRRYRGRLYLHEALPAFDESWQQSWRPAFDGDRLELPGNGHLVARQTGRDGIVLDGPVQVRYRRPGESCRLTGRPLRPLKKIFQDLDIPPWLRSRIPLLCVEDSVVWIPGAGACQAESPATSPTTGGGSAWRFSWCLPPYSF